MSNIRNQLTNLPNLVTMGRVLFVPGVLYFMDNYSPVRSLIAALLYLVASIGDGIDGYLARSRNEVSVLGKFLDPVADKLMVAAALIVLVKLNLVDVFIAFIIIGREITISALREWMAQLGNSKSVAVSMLGKFKTAFQMVAILFLLYQETLLGISTLWWGNLLMYLAAVLTLWSMVYYMMLAMPQILEKSRNQN